MDCELAHQNGDSTDPIATAPTLHDDAEKALAQFYTYQGITHRYVSNKFIPDYDPTIEDYYNRSALIANETVQVSILDTAGMEDYYPLIDDWIDKKNAFVLVFSIDIPDSLRKLRYFHEKIKQRYEDVPHASKRPQDEHHQ